jgi:beta-lactamase class A
MLKPSFHSARIVSVSGARAVPGSQQRDRASGLTNFQRHSVPNMPRARDGSRSGLFALIVLTFALATFTSTASEIVHGPKGLQNYQLDYDSKVDPVLQSKLERIDSELRTKYGMSPTQTAVGVLDLKEIRLAMLHPDREEYAASVAKLGILLAWFQLHPEAPTNLNSETRHELGLMVKASSNEMAAKFSRQLGLRQIQQVLNSQHFYDTNHGGGIWVGKHYGQGGERIGDPVADNSHAATVRQLLRFYLLLEQNKLVSPEASKTMLEIFASPEIPHDDIKFVKALADRKIEIIRKWGTWENWFHDSAVISGPNRHYILVALTNHPKGDDYLVDLAKSVDDFLAGVSSANGTSH